MSDVKRPPTAYERILGKAPRHEPEVEEAEVRDAFDDGGYTKTRGREAIMLDVRKANGQRHAMSYAYLTRIDYEPGDLMKLHFADEVVQVRGRRLADLYSRLMDHRVVAIQEGTLAEEGLKPEGAAHIDRLEIIRRTEAEHDSEH